MSKIERYVAGWRIHVSTSLVSAEDGHEPWNAFRVLEAHWFLRVACRGTSSGCHVSNLRWGDKSSAYVQIVGRT